MEVASSRHGALADNAVVIGALNLEISEQQ